MLRQLVKNSFYGFQRRSARLYSHLLAARPGTSRQRLVFFSLHAIAAAESDMAVSPSRFRSQLSGLLRAGYVCLDLPEALEVASGKRPLAAPAFVLTFDDGYASVYEHAAPILDDLGLSATLFITVNFLNRRIAPPWKSRNPALLREYRNNQGLFEPLAWNHVLELARSGRFRVGSHSLNHPLLGHLDIPELQSELRDSRSILEDRLGVEVPYFSYPFGVRSYGAFSERTETEVLEAGYRCSCTSEIGRVRAGAGAYLLPRISLVDMDNESDARAKAVGAYDWVGVAQRSFQRVFPNPHREPL